MSREVAVRRRLRAFVTWPALHFVLLGALLCGLEQQLRGPTSDRQGQLDDIQPVVITASQVEQLRRDWRRGHGRPPNRSEEKALLDELIDTEVLFREALRQGLDRRDLVVYRRLTQKMRLLSEDPSLPADELYRQAVALGLGRDDLIVRRRLVQRMRLLAVAEGGAVRPSEAEIRDYYERHLQRFQRPARVRISHLFFRREEHREGLERECRRLLEELNRQRAAPPQVVSLGEPFVLGNHLPLRTVSQLERSFGPRFADRVMDFEPGLWNGPVESAYGWHLVWVHEIQPASQLDLETVRQQLLQGLRDERREQRLAGMLERLRRRYPVRFDFSTAARQQEAS